MMIKQISLHLSLDDQENSLLDQASQRRDSTSGIFHAKGNAVTETFKLIVKDFVFLADNIFSLY